MSISILVSHPSPPRTRQFSLRGNHSLETPTAEITEYKPNGSSFGLIRDHFHGYWYSKRALIWSFTLNPKRGGQQTLIKCETANVKNSFPVSIRSTRTHGLVVSWYRWILVGKLSTSLGGAAFITLYSSYSGSHGYRNQQLLVRA